jgi:hypothetical protein
MQSLEQLKKRIVSFVNQTTTANFALMIDGKWGSGKTYFIKEILFPTLYQQTSNKPALYVSLNGVNSFEEIYEQLTTEKFLLKRWAKTKVGKATIGAFNAARKLYGNKILNDLMKEAKIKLEDFADFSKNVIVFDDLERIGNDLSIKDLFGFINTNFIEHNTTKVIIVGWEQKMTKLYNKNDNPEKQHIEYFEAKNKLVNWTLNFENDIENIIRNIIVGYSPDSKNKTAQGLELYYLEFHDFMSKYQEFLIRHLIKPKEKNLRNILFIFDTLLSIHRQCSSLISSCSKHEVERIILATIIMCLEYRHQRLNEQHQDIYQHKDSLLLLSIKKENKEYRGSYISEFQRKYIEINSRDYWYFASIEDYVKGKQFSITLFKKELDKNRERSNQYNYEEARSILHWYEWETDERYLQAWNQIKKILNDKKQSHSFKNLLSITISFVRIEKSNTHLPYNIDDLYKKIESHLLNVPITHISDVGAFESQIEEIEQSHQKLATIFIKKSNYNELNEYILLEAKKDINNKLVLKNGAEDTFCKLISLQTVSDFFKLDLLPLLDQPHYVFGPFLTLLQKLISDKTLEEKMGDLKLIILQYKEKLPSSKFPVTIIKLNKILELFN